MRSDQKGSGRFRDNAKCDGCSSDRGGGGGGGAGMVVIISFSVMPTGKNTKAS